MQFSESQLQHLQTMLRNHDSDNDGFLDAVEIDRLLVDVGMDNCFGAALHRVLACHSRGVCFEFVLDFFLVLTSGNVRCFYCYIFNAIDLDGDGHIDAMDLMGFAALISEHMDRRQAASILNSYGVDENGLLSFDSLWEWRKAEHGMRESEDSDLSDEFEWRSSLS
jgi:Ca2+-binding EF-hand superfamily protein